MEETRVRGRDSLLYGCLGQIDASRIATGYFMIKELQKGLCFQIAILLTPLAWNFLPLCLMFVTSDLTI